jgi:hypothetical protein
VHVDMGSIHSSMRARYTRGSFKVVSPPSGCVDGSANKVNARSPDRHFGQRAPGDR